MNESVGIPTKLKKFFKVVGKDIVLFVVVVAMILFLPFYALFNMVRRIFKVKPIKFDLHKKRNFVSAHVVKYWLGESKQAQNTRVFVGFLFPVFIAYTLFVIIPFVTGVYFSFTNWNGLNAGNEDFVKWDNYKYIFKDIKFVYSFVRTVIYSLLNIIFINAVAFSLALLVTQKLKLENIYRAGFFMPNLIGGLVLGYIWKFIFNEVVIEFGGRFSTSFLVDGDTALFALIAVVTWQYAGYIMMIYIAAIQNVPQDLVEASKIDGANMWQRLRTVIMPLIAQAFTVSLFLTLVTSFKQFDTVWSLTGGGPATQVPTWLTGMYGFDLVPAQSLKFIAIDIYKEAYTNYNMGIGQAKAIVFFIFLLLVSMVQVSYNKRKEVEL